MDAAAARSLKHDEEERFNAALLDAFTDDFQLEQMLWFRLGRKLSEIVPGESDQKRIVFNLIRAASAGGWWAQLLLAARNSQPHNPVLLAFAEEVGLAVATPVAPPPEPGAPDPADEKRPWPWPLDVETWRARLGEIEGRVCRIELQQPDGSRRPSGTGFLVGPDLVMTAWQVMQPVIQGPTRPQDVIFRFDYKRLPDGVTVNPGTEYHLVAEDWLVAEAPFSQQERTLAVAQGIPDPDALSYALMRLDRAAGNDPLGRWGEPNAEPRGWIAPPTVEPHVVPGAAFYMVQHPQGEPLHVEAGTLTGFRPDSGDTRLRYRVRAAVGSSGAPCFDDRWQLIAIHHSKLLGADGLNSPFAEEREGIMVGAVLRHIARQLLGRAAPPKAIPAAESEEPQPQPTAAQPLDGRTTERLVEALVSAFPDVNRLRMMVRFGLDLNLETISGDESLPETVFNLIQWADSQGQVGALIRAARQQNPQNFQLQSIAEQLGLNT